MTSVESSTKSPNGVSGSGGGRRRRAGTGGSTSRTSKTTTTNNKKKKNKNRHQHQPQQLQQQQPVNSQLPAASPSSSSPQHQNLSDEAQSGNQHNQKQQLYRRSKRRQATALSSSSSSPTGTSLPGSNTPTGTTSSSDNNDIIRNKLADDVVTDPLKVISIAVRYDESMALAQTHDERILTRPLETGRIYDHRLFTAALFLLDTVTTVNPSSVARSGSMVLPSSSTMALKKTRKDKRTKRNPIPFTSKDEFRSVEDSSTMSTFSATTQDAAPVNESDARPTRSQTTSLSSLSTRIDFCFNDTDSDFTISTTETGIIDSTPLTPIILSGLLANLQQQQQQQIQLQHTGGDNEEEEEEHRRPALIDENTDRYVQDHQKERREVTSMQPPPPTTTPSRIPNSTELVSYTMQLRRAAIQRVRLSKQRKRINRIVTPILTITAVVFLYFYTMSSLRSVIEAYGFGTDMCERGVEHHQLHSEVWNGSTIGTEQPYDLACRLAAASVWEHLHGTSHYHLGGSGSMSGGRQEKYSKHYVGGLSPPYSAATSQQLQQQILQVATGDISKDSSCNLDGCFEIPSPIPLYAMHTQLYDVTIPLDVVMKGKLHRVSSSGSISQSSFDGKKINSAMRLPIQWLGETTVNRIVRESLVSATANWTTGTAMKLLDIGSGLSGTLFSLLTTDFPYVKYDKHYKQYDFDFSYVGIAISGPEVTRARELLKAHGITSTIESTVGEGGTSSPAPRINATVLQASFDDILPDKSFTSMVAIESLSYSENLNRTLHNLANSLTKSSSSQSSSPSRSSDGGVLIIVDDVVQPWADTKRIRHVANATAKYSLKTYVEWRQLLVSAGFNIRSVRDLSLEYDAPDLFSASDTSSQFSKSIGRTTPKHRIKRTWYELASDWLGRWSKNSRGSVIGILRDLLENANMHHERDVSYKTSDLGYYLFVCTL